MQRGKLGTLSTSSHVCRLMPTVTRDVPTTPVPLRNPQKLQSRASSVDIDGIYTANEAEIQPYIGSVKAVRLRASCALETSKSLAAGETLLVSTPLALVHHSAAETDAEAANAGYEEDQYEPTDEDVDQLLEQLISSSDARTQGWLQHLNDGSLQPSTGNSSQLPDLEALASSSSTDSPAAPAAPAAADLTEDTLLDITDINTRVLFEDAGLVSLRAQSRVAPAADSDAAQLEPDTLVGIWPELTLVPHSCCPNTSVVAVNPAAVVTTARNIPKQGVIYQNFLGPRILAPLKERRSLLQKMTGQQCMCPRCRDEEKQDKNFLQLIEDIYEACQQQITPELEAAVEADDEEALESLCDQLGAYCEVVDAGFSKLAVKQQTQIWLQASLFKLYELTAIASAAATGEPDARSMELLAALAGEVCPGSNEHIFWADQYRTVIAADEESYFDGALRQAETMLKNAYTARYGNISKTLYQQLQEQNRLEEGEDDEEGERR